MKKTVNLFILIGTIGLLTMGCSRSPEKFADNIAEKVAKKLDLDDGQKEKLNRIKIVALAEYKERKANRGEHKETVKKMLLSDRLDKNKIKSIINNKKEKFEVKFEKYFPLIEDFHASLNTKQKEKLVILSEKMHKRRGHWH